jgi:hypothetical protein
VPSEPESLRKLARSSTHSAPGTHVKTWRSFSWWLGVGRPVFHLDVRGCAHAWEWVGVQALGWPLRVARPNPLRRLLVAREVVEGELSISSVRSGGCIVGR